MMTTHLQKQHKMGEAGKPVTCEKCGKEYSSLHYLQQHIQSVHLGLRRVSCPHCDFTCMTASTLRKHLPIHSVSLEARKRVMCQFCNHRALNNTHLKRHISVVHRGAKQYRCRPCGTLYSNNTNLTEHIGSKHMGYSVREWRLPENKTVRRKAMEHEYYQYVPVNQDGVVVPPQQPQIPDEEADSEEVILAPRRKAIVTRPKGRRMTR